MRAPWTAPSRFAAQIARTGVTEIIDFGSNPGRLRMLVYAPATPLPAGSALIVVLHGCDQEPADFAAAAGWMSLADRLGFGLVLPEQLQENNQGRCFNWFEPGDTRRGRGEVLSIRQMVAEAALRLRSDPAEVYVVGLSAGGAMAGALLAAYPDVFKAGAIVAGLPVGSARNMSDAFARMGSAGPPQSGEALAARVHTAAPARFNGTWPRLSIWHGALDKTVDPGNAELLAAQWSHLHGVQDAIHAQTGPLATGRHRVWGRPDSPDVELWTIEHLAHGYPVDPGSRAGGFAAPWVIEAGISATDQIARFWGLSVF
jgi:poly(hydroxyalkanoate) depolymerase family esterase